MDSLSTLFKTVAARHTWLLIPREVASVTEELDFYILLNFMTLSLNGVMVRFMCQLDWAVGRLDCRSNIPSGRVCEGVSARD